MKKYLIAFSAVFVLMLNLAACRTNTPEKPESSADIVSSQPDTASEASLQRQEDINDGAVTDDNGIIGDNEDNRNENRPDNLVSDAVSATESVLDNAGDAVDNAADKAGDAVNNAADSLGDGISTTVSAVESTAESVADNTADFVAGDDDRNNDGRDDDTSMRDDSITE